MTDHDVGLVAEPDIRGAVDLFRSALHVPPLADEEWQGSSEVNRTGRRHGVWDGDSGA
ncbi:hypothetical protein [Saccharomonospora sp. CUA-673]|uniref:hypothetical protein n=1 Tax=Saccharomonospora sp. CUA-673 TaxID=1904969 RepID=UPI003514212D